MIEIDGSKHEGGGQMLRTALALSALTGKPFKMTKIRSGRSKPGLKAQHMHVLKSLEALTEAKVEGGVLGSEKVIFEPTTIKEKNLNIDVGTAGSITLIMQALSPLLAFMNVKIKIIGGTDVKWSPSYDYFVNVYGRILKNYCAFTPSLLKRGYFPKGQGKCEFIFKSEVKRSVHASFENFWQELTHVFKPIIIKHKGELMHVKGVSHASASLIQRQIAERMAKASSIIESANTRTEYSQSESDGAGITLWAIMENSTVGVDVLGDVARMAEDVGKVVTKKLLNEIQSENGVDEHLADQILIFMALLPGSKIRMNHTTKHMRSEIYVIESFLPISFNYDNYFLETSLL